MPQQLELKFKGLYTHPNQFSEVPQGALSQADNVVIDRESIVSTRRGYKRYGNSVGAVDVKAIIQFGGRLIEHNSDGTLHYDSGAGVWIDYTGTYASPNPSTPGSRIRAVEANKNLYFTSQAGIYKLAQITDTPTLAGAPKALGGVGVATGSSGFLSPQKNVAYRIVWGYKDSNKNLILGVPSERIVVSNPSSSASSNAQLTFLVPVGVDENWFYQVYRSDQSATINDSPSDEMQQVYESNPTSAQITAKEIVLVDSVPDELRQGVLYTSPSREGISQANWQPPFASDIALYKNLTLYANTRSPQRYFPTLIASGGTSGLQIGDTVTVVDTATGGHTFTVTGGAAENPSTGVFQVFTSGSPAQNIENTSRSLVSIINKYAANTFINAYYMSDFQDLPGKMLFEKRSLNASPFYVNSSNNICWTPQIPTTGTIQESSSDAFQNRLFISKFQQPEAVPLLNYIDVGSANSAIRRIFALRDGIIILKDEGVFRISGQDINNFTLALLDNTVRILAENTAVVLANQVFFLSDQGVVAASEQGVAVFSRPIEKTLIEFTSPTLHPNFEDLSFAVSYNSDRKYILAMPYGPTDTCATQQFVYNTFTNSWTRWTRSFTCGVLNELDNKLYFGGINDPVFGGYVFQERKDFSTSDYTDDQYDVAVTSYSGTRVHITSVVPLDIGYVISQASTGIQTVITGVVSPGVYTVDQDYVWGIAAAIAYSPIDCNILTVQQDCGNPGMFKHIRDCSLLFQEVNFDTVNVGFTSDYSSIEYSVILKSRKTGSWGAFPWGGAPWGAGLTGQQRLRTLVPSATQRVNWFTIHVQNKQAFSGFAMAGISLVFEPMSERQK